MRGSIEIKPQGKSICIDFIIFMYICSKPVYFTISDMFLSHSSKFGYPFGLHFGQYVATISNLIFKHKKYTLLEFRALASQGYPGHITEEGGTRRPRRHPGGTQRHPGAQGHLGVRMCHIICACAQKWWGRLISRARERRDHHRLTRLRTRFCHGVGVKSRRTNT